MNLTEILRSKETSIVDVRTKGEFSSSRLEGSINIPLNLIPENIEALKKTNQFMFIVMQVVEVLKLLKC